MLKFQKNTMIGLYAMMELARVPDERLATSALAERFHVSVHHLSKVLQQLTRAGLARTTRGVLGGYALAKDPGEITLYDVVELFEGPRVEGYLCLLMAAGDDSGQGPHCLLHPVVAQLDEQVAATLESISLESLLRGAKPPG
ncbi:MAG: Rrf2 family transcriptional regulator [Planctomycetota bacterium]|nr:Rrf2 family transcriptional regulator [Planctomycetota bacterium]